MAKFPTQFAPEKLGITGRTAVRADLDVRTGGQELAGAIAGFGGAIANLGLRWDLMQASTQLNEAKMKARQEHTRLMLSLPGLEPDEHTKEYENSIKVQQGFMPTNRRAAGAYRQLLNDFAPQWELNVENAMKAKLKDNFRAIGFGMQQEAIQSGDFADYFKHLATGEKKVFAAYTAEEVAKYKQTTIDDRERYMKLQANQQLEQLEIQREKDRDILGNALDDATISYPMINATILEEKEQESYRIKMNAEAARKAKGEVITTDLARKHELLDMAAAIKWPERQIDAKEVKQLANEARYGINPTLDNVAYDELRDAIRRAEEDKIPFTQKFIETIIGELITGAPSSILGFPLPTLRTREDAIKHATNAFGRFVGRVPGVMDTIDSIPRYAPEKHKSIPEESKDNPAYDFDGELIGGYNPNGSITLNDEGLRRLMKIAEGDEEKAREIADQNRYIILP